MESQLCYGKDSTRDGVLGVGVCEMHGHIVHAVLMICRYWDWPRSTLWLLRLQPPKTRMAVTLNYRKMR